ncbi:MAG: potassium transporter [Tannerellaceae bacterium]|nr:potassium transporter [Tannerellaceae bacterium]
MDIKHTLFIFRVHGEEIKKSLYTITELIILSASLVALLLLIYQFGFEQSEPMEQLIWTIRPYILVTFFIGITGRYMLNFHEVIQEKMLFLDISIYFLLFAVLSATLFFKEAFATSLPYLSFLSSPFLNTALLFSLSIIHISRLGFSLLHRRIRPSLLFLFSFLLFILIGWGLLLLPNATTQGISFMDALFTSATAVCITGLTTVDIATTFTRTGHTIIMILSQIGGIGVMTFTSFIALSFMKSSSYNSKLILKDMLYEERTGGLFRVILNILVVTLFIEGIGGYLIFKEIETTLPGTFGDHVFFAAFHAIAAFCCSGISTLSGGFTHPLLVHNYSLHIIISLLIVLGSIGFPIVFNYLKLARHLFMNQIRILLGLQKRFIHVPHIINLHTYIVIISTLFLITTGFIFFLFFEYNHTLADLPLKGKLADAFLGAVTPRTAGISPIEIDTLSAPTLILTLLLMIIGAGPMSTGGGLKVTTVFVALLTMFSIIREKENVELKKRELSPVTLKRAFAIIVIYFTLLACLMGILSYTEKELPLFELLFECVSALSTVGLSMGITSSLSTVGKILIVITMLIGRIGLLTFFMTFWTSSKKKNYAYPKENVLM